MNAFSNLKIRTKLMVSFLGLAGLAAVVGWLGLADISRLSTEIEDLRKETLAPLRELSYAQTVFLMSRVDVRDIIIKTDRVQQRELLRAVEDGDRQLEARLKAFRSSRLTKQEEEYLSQIDALLPAYRRDRGDLIDLAMAGRQKEAVEALFGPVRKTQGELRERLRLLLSSTPARRRGCRGGHCQRRSRQRLMIIVVGIALLVSISLGLSSQNPSAIPSASWSMLPAVGRRRRQCEGGSRQPG